MICEGLLWASIFDTQVLFAPPVFKLERMPHIACNVVTCHPDKRRGKPDHRLGKLSFRQLVMHSLKVRSHRLGDFEQRPRRAVTAFADCGHPASRLIGGEVPRLPRCQRPELQLPFVFLMRQNSPVRLELPTAPELAGLALSSATPPGDVENATIDPSGASTGVAPRNFRHRPSGPTNSTAGTGYCGRRRGSRC